MHLLGLENAIKNWVVARKNLVALKTSMELFSTTSPSQLVNLWHRKTFWTRKTWLRIKKNSFGQSRR